MVNHEHSDLRPAAHRVRDLARALDMHPVSIYRLIASGKIEVTRIGGAVRIPEREWRRLTGAA